MSTYEVHPIAERYPLLEGEEFERLKASIAANGVQVPGVLFAGRILDGRNRYRACVALGIEFPTTTFEGSEEAAAVYSDVLNLHRRHLSREQVRDVIAFKLRAEPHRSDRDIAAEVQVSPTTVGTVRKEVVASGVQLGHLTAGGRKGRDGKKYTVPKAKPAKVEMSTEEFDQRMKHIKEQQAAMFAEAETERTQALARLHEERAKAEAESQPTSQEPEWFNLFAERDFIIKWLHKRVCKWPTELQTCCEKVITGIARSVAGAFEAEAYCQHLLAADSLPHDEKISEVNNNSPAEDARDKDHAHLQPENMNLEPQPVAKTFAP